MTSGNVYSYCGAGVTGIGVGGIGGLKDVFLVYQIFLIIWTLF
jgi:hypothetical protein